MDPLQTLINLDQLISDGNYASAVIMLQTYYQWRIRGGFEPRTCEPMARENGDAFADKCAWRIADAVRKTAPLQIQRDELLTALRGLLKFAGGMYPRREWSENHPITIARAAIAKAEKLS